MKINVLFIGGTRYSSPLNPTDEKKMKALSEKFNMTYIAFNKENEKLFFHQYADFYLISSGIVNYFRQFYFLLYSFFKGLTIIKEKKIEVIICQSPFEGIVGVLLKKVRKTKLIVEIHSEWDKAPVAYKRINKHLKWVTDFAGNWSLKSSDAIRVISSKTKSLIEKFDKLVFQFAAFTDIEMFLNTKEEVIIKNRFVFVGQLIKLKGISTIIESVSILKRNGNDIEIIIIGKGNDECFFKDKVKEKNLERNFKFIGRNTQKDIAKYIKSSNALILPSHTEGFGRVIIESFACERPVIGSNVGGIPELVIDNETGYLIKSGDSKSLADKMLLILNNQEKALKMGKKGKNAVKIKYNTKNYCENYKNMADRVIAI